jgi:hypothetical protein
LATFGVFGPPSSPPFRSQGLSTGDLCICSGISRIYSKKRASPKRPDPRASAAQLSTPLTKNFHRSQQYALAPRPMYLVSQGQPDRSQAQSGGFTASGRGKAGRFTYPEEFDHSTCPQNQPKPTHERGRFTLPPPSCSAAAEEVRRDALPT